jgi:hypothetical protein
MLQTFCVMALGFRVKKRGVDVKRNLAMFQPPTFESSFDFGCAISDFGNVSDGIINRSTPQYFTRITSFLT